MNNSETSDTRILEGLVTTLGPDGEVNISPMGPRVDAAMSQFVLRPFESSKTLANLRRTGVGILHVTDDVLLVAQAAVGQPDPLPKLQPAVHIEGRVISDACRWYEFRVKSLDDSQQRATIVVEVLGSGHGRDFFGFNRAMYAVLEATILATRVHLIPPEEIWRQVRALEPLVQKTGGPREVAAMQFVQDYLRRAMSVADQFDVGQ